MNIWTKPSALSAMTTICVALLIAQAGAGDRTTECTSVVSKATITLSGKLLLGLFEDPVQKTCDFVVSMPPPNTANTAAKAWYAIKADAADSKLAPKIFAELAVSLIPEREKSHSKDVIMSVLDNAALASDCFTALFKKVKSDFKSKDGRFACSIPSEAEGALIRISNGNRFALTIMVPRPSPV